MSNNELYSGTVGETLSTGSLNGVTQLANNIPAISTNDQTPPKQTWTAPRSAEFDFRSDTQTSPTLNMLKAIENTSLFDDVFAEDTTTNDLEAHIASMTNHEAALFVLSGTMGNQLAMRSHLTQPPYAILCDHRAHLKESEAGGVATLSGAMIEGVVPKNGIYLTLEDVKKHVVLGDEIHHCPTRVISLENTLGGTIMPLNEVKRISEFAEEQGIKMHLDGARLWEAVVAGAGSLPDYTSQFDSVSLCFSKGLGAPIGSILVGKKDFIKHARWIRKSIGGGLRQSGVVTAAARVAVDETFGTGPNGENSLLRQGHIIAQKIAKTWTTMGGKLQHPTETNMVWFDLDDAGITAEEFVKIGDKHRIKLFGGRLVVHYQISTEGVERLGKVMDEVLRNRGSSQNGSGNTEERVGQRTYGSYLVNK